MRRGGNAEDRVHSRAAQKNPHELRLRASQVSDGLGDDKTGFRPIAHGRSRGASMSTYSPTCPPSCSGWITDNTEVSHVSRISPD